MLTENLYLYALNLFPGLGYNRLKSLLNQYKSFQNIWNSDFSTWKGIPESVRTVCGNQKPTLNLNLIDNQLTKNGYRVLSFVDYDYPSAFNQIDTPPALLVYKGDLTLMSSTAIAIVGTRNISSYGKLVVQNFIPDLVANSLVIVSGFQRGVDSAAHKEAIRNQGKTIAVLGTGLDVDYPAGNRSLFNSIIDSGGLIISEYPLGTQPIPQNFPRRNRLVAALSLATLVVEASEKSGSLITARLSVEQGKEVFAVPGNIFLKSSSGPHSLIKKGAYLVDSVSEILSCLGFVGSKKILIKNNIDSPILKYFEGAELNIDQLVEKSGLSVKQILSEISLLELDGVLAQTAPGLYLKIK